ncbi:MAG: hypothetical protein K2K34_01935, partial [Oscillospiraceae bacterium]|nr:hypothetical protein [Oscillospiraceae bacterium]
VEIVFIRNDVDFNDPEVIQELFNLEYGANFVQYSDEDGSVQGAGGTEEAVPDTDGERSDPDRVYISKEDALTRIREE